jgi:hypothetical protein
MDAVSSRSVGTALAHRCCKPEVAGNVATIEVDPIVWTANGVDLSIDSWGAARQPLSQGWRGRIR